MTKSELIQIIADRNPPLYHRDVERIVSTIFDEISAALAQGDRVELLLDAVEAAQMTAWGVFERFPQLRIFWAENNIGWIPYYYGPDTRRVDYKYKGVGRVVFGRNRYSGATKVIRVDADSTEDGY